MTSAEAAKLISNLTEAVADWQRGAMLGRKTATAEAKAARAAAKLFQALTGEKPTEEEVSSILRAVGLV